MQLNGRFIIFPDTPQEIILPNSIVDEGEDALFAMALQADNTIVAGAGNFYIGLCGDTGVASDAVLADLLDEPGLVNGYARQPVIRSAAGWTIDRVGGYSRARSSTVNFIGSGGNFDTAITRAFLCSVLTGTAGTLFSVSHRLTAPKTILDTETYPVVYELYGKGS